jgi:hypothetical protein
MPDFARDNKDEFLADHQERLKRYEEQNERPAQ